MKIRRPSASRSSSTRPKRFFDWNDAKPGAARVVADVSPLPAPLGAASSLVGRFPPAAGERRRRSGSFRRRGVAGPDRIAGGVRQREALAQRGHVMDGTGRPASSCGTPRSACDRSRPSRMRSPVLQIEHLARDVIAAPLSSACGEQPAERIDERRAWACRHDGRERVDDVAIAGIVAGRCARVVVAIGERVSPRLIGRRRERAVRIDDVNGCARRDRSASPRAVVASAGPNSSVGAGEGGLIRPDDEALVVVDLPAGDAKARTRARPGRARRCAAPGWSGRGRRRTGARRGSGPSRTCRVFVVIRIGRDVEVVPVRSRWDGRRIALPAPSTNLPITDLAPGQRQWDRRRTRSDCRWRQRCAAIWNGSCLVRGRRMAKRIDHPHRKEIVSWVVAPPSSRCRSDRGCPTAGHSRARPSERRACSTLLSVDQVVAARIARGRGPGVRRIGGGKRRGGERQVEPGRQPAMGDAQGRPRTWVAEASVVVAVVERAALRQSSVSPAPVTPNAPRSTASRRRSTGA